MSQTTGAEVPDQVAQLFDGRDLAGKLGLGFLLVTVDPAGWPRPPDHRLVPPGSEARR